VKGDSDGHDGVQFGAAGVLKEQNLGVDRLMGIREKPFTEEVQGGPGL